MKVGTKSINRLFGIITKMAFVVVLCAGCARVGSQSVNYEEFYKTQRGLPTEELLRLGQKNQYYHPDSALFYFNMVVARCNNASSREEKRFYAEALTNIGYAHFMSGSDYQQAFTYYLKSTDLCLENNFENLLMRNYNNLGCVYSVFEDFEFSRDYFKKAFYLGIKEKEWEVVTVSFANMASDALEQGSLPQIKEEIELFNTLELPAHTPNGEMMKNYGRAMAAILQENYTSSRCWFDSMEACVHPDEVFFARSKAFVLINRTKTYALEENWKAAIQISLQAEELLDGEEGADDLRVINLRNISEYYSRLGNETLSVKYLAKAVTRQDNHLNSKKLNSVHHIKSAYEADRFSELMQREEKKRHTQAVILCIVLLVLLVLSVVAGWIIRQNKLLKEKNIEIYRRCQEILEQSEREKRQREEQLRLESVQQDPIQQGPAPEKYQGNNLDQKRKETLLNSVLSIMDQSPEIYSSDFSIARLAELVGSGQKYISQVINELYGDNFNKLLAKYRIREACRRIKDTANFGHLTLDAIAGEVGFKSVPNFYATFKREVGLTPSQYRKIGLEFIQNSENRIS